jgi:hypothetical protein
VIEDQTMTGDYIDDTDKKDIMFLFKKGLLDMARQKKSHFDTLQAH